MTRKKKERVERERKASRRSKSSSNDAVQLKRRQSKEMPHDTLSYTLSTLYFHATDYKKIGLVKQMKPTLTKRSEEA